MEQKTMAPRIVVILNIDETTALQSIILANFCCCGINMMLNKGKAIRKMTTPKKK
jgi:hypothetical protein